MSVQSHLPTGRKFSFVILTLIGSAGWDFGCKKYLFILVLNTTYESDRKKAQNLNMFYPANSAYIFSLSRLTIEIDLTIGFLDEILDLTESVSEGFPSYVLLHIRAVVFVLYGGPKISPRTFI